MRNIAFKWLKKAQVDLKAAKDSLEAGNYEWSCFQQDIQTAWVGISPQQNSTKNRMQKNV